MFQLYKFNSLNPYEINFVREITLRTFKYIVYTTPVTTSAPIEFFDVFIRNIIWEIKYRDNIRLYIDEESKKEILTKLDRLLSKIKSVLKLEIITAPQEEAEHIQQLPKSKRKKIGVVANSADEIV